MNVLYTILSFTIVFGIIVLVHEFGHYMAARMVGVRVEAFSFGFGKRIWGKKIGDTDFRISLVPLGGYVKMAGEEEYDPDDLKPYEFHAKNRGQKILILIMGPLMNLLLAFLIFTVINMVGIPKPQYKKEAPVIGYVEKDSPAERAGLQKGDQIVAIGGEKVKDWEELELNIGSNANENLRIQFMRDGQLQDTKLAIASSTRHSMGYAGIYHDKKVVVDKPRENTQSEKAGLKNGDILVSINNEPVNYYQLPERTTEGIGKELLYQFERHTVIKPGKGDDKPVIKKDRYTVRMTPERTYELEGEPVDTAKEVEKVIQTARKKLKDNNIDLAIGYIVSGGKYIAKIDDQIDDRKKVEEYSRLLGFNIKEKGVVGFFLDTRSPRILEQYGLFGAMGKGIADIKRLTFMVFNVFRKMIRGKISAGSISGPLEIAKFSQKAMESGATNFFMLIAFISLQLGIINLFPIPALDGGHLLIFTIESIIRKDFSPRVKMILMNVGFILLLSLMVLIILNDIAKELPNGWNSFIPF